jgi:hypothetical protein
MPEIEYEYHQAIHKASKNDLRGVPSKLIQEFRNDNLFTFGQINIASMKFENLKESIVELVEFINSNGPYDGIVGFSHGGLAIKTALNSHLFSFPCPQITHPPKFLIYFSVPNF